MRNEHEDWISEIISSARLVNNVSAPKRVYEKTRDELKGEINISSKRINWGIGVAAAIVVLFANGMAINGYLANQKVESVEIEQKYNSLISNYELIYEAI